MKFLLNMNIPPQLGQMLEQKKHHCRHASPIGLSKASDSKIIEVARQVGETIITNDLDYGHLLAFAGARNPSVIIFRVSNTHAKRLYKLISGVLETEEDSLKKGAIIVIEDHNVRIRLLPIVREQEP